MNAGDRGEQGGGEARLRAAYLHELPQLRRIVGGLGFGPSDADDILQDVFLEVQRGRAAIGSEDDARCWLVRVTVNRSLLEYRRRRRYRRRAEAILGERRAPWSREADDVNDAAVRAEEVASVQDALRKLDGLTAALLVLRYFCEMDSTEIGAMLGAPAGTVRSRLHEARLSLAQALARRGIVE